MVAIAVGVFVWWVSQRLDTTKMVNISKILVSYLQARHFVLCKDLLYKVSSLSPRWDVLILCFIRCASMYAGNGQQQFIIQHSMARFYAILARQDAVGAARRLPSHRRRLHCHVRHRVCVRQHVVVLVPFSFAMQKLSVWLSLNTSVLAQGASQTKTHLYHFVSSG